jgi:glycosyltransferase involved in cell wall biosynthesis
MGDTPIVSVVIPAYNSASFVADAAKSALAQTLAPLEVIVVDDGSTDGTDQALEPLLHRTHMIRQDNQGVGAARNAGIRLARGDYIAFLDADDVWLPKKLERQMRLFAQDPRVAMVHCGLIEVDQAMHPVGERLDGLEGDDVAMKMLHGQGGLLHGVGSTVVVTREAIGEVGPYDIEVPPSEDWEFSYRIARRYRIAFVREPLVLYRQHAGNAHRNIPHQERGMMLALNKVFDTDDPEVLRLKRRSYATVHAWLAGSYWETRDMRPFLRHTLAAGLLYPPALRRAAGFPIRRLLSSRRIPSARSIS